MAMRDTPLETAKNKKITVNLYYDFIDEIYTIERKTKHTKLTERTKDRRHATKIFYYYLYYSMNEIKSNKGA